MRRIGLVAIVFVGLTAVSQTIVSAFVMLGLLSVQLQGMSRRMLLVGGGSAALLSLASLAFGLMLIVWRKRLATRWFDDDDEDPLNIDGLTLMRVGLVLVGVSTVVAAVTMLIVSVPDIVLSMRKGSAVGMGGLLGARRVGSSPFNSVVRLCLGAVLVWWSEPLARFAIRERPSLRRTRPTAPATCPHCSAPYNPSDYREDAEPRCSACHQPLPRAGA